MKVQYWIQPFVPAEVKEPEMFDSLQEAEEEREHWLALQPENYYAIMVEVVE